MNKAIKIAKQTLALESAAIEHLSANLDESFDTAVQIMHNCRGKVVICGVGKSGHIAKKIAATMASTGTAAFFLHAAEASHGDLGMLQKTDVLILISYSGTAKEIVEIFASIKKIGCVTIAISGNPQSDIARFCDVFLNIAVEKEACPLELAPTCSSTVTLALGDALAMALMQQKQFSSKDFATYHPKGALGKKLLLTVADIMTAKNKLPIVTENCTIQAAILEMSNKCFGMTTVINNDNKLCGIFTDGDLRRALNNKDFLQEKISYCMTKNPVTINKDTLAIDALTIMDTKKIQHLVVTNNSNIEGLVQIYDITKNGIEL